MIATLSVRAAGSAKPAAEVTRPVQSSAAGSPGEPGVWPLPHQPQAAGQAREVTRVALTAWGVREEAIAMVLLVVSELVTNAVEHALPPVALRLARPADSVHIEVDDGGPAPRKGEWIASCSDDEHGRGTGIIDSLATCTGTHSRPCGATHWADLPGAA
ncbi:ATP-binding protein [Streptomyces sp. NPDC055709]